DACLEPAFRRIVVLDSVSVLQAKVLEVGIDPVELPMLRTVLTPLLGTTTFEGMALDALTYVALGGLYGASLYLARASDPRAWRGFPWDRPPRCSTSPAVRDLSYASRTRWVQRSRVSTPRRSSLPWLVSARRPPICASVRCMSCRGPAARSTSPSPSTASGA